MRAPQFFRIGAGHRVERKPLASSNTPASRIPCGERCFVASNGRSLSLRPSRLLASLSDRTRVTNVLPAHGGFYVPASGRRVTPTSVGI